MHARRWWYGAFAAVLAGSLIALWLKPMLEQAVHARIEAVALRHGVAARLGTVRVGLWPLLRLEGVDLDLGHGLQLRADSVAVTWPAPLRFSVRGARIAGPAGLTLAAAHTGWKVSGIYFGDPLEATLLEPRPGLSLRRHKDPAGSSWQVTAHSLEAGRLFDLRRDDRPLLDGGIADGQLALQSRATSLGFQVDLGARGARLGALGGDAAEEPALGEPTDVNLKFEGNWQPEAGALAIPGFRATVAGADLAGSLSLTHLDDDPAIDLALALQRLDFAPLLGTSGLDVPEGLGLSPGRTPDLGSAAIDVSIRGRLAEPASLAVTQKVDFKPPRELPTAITRLRGDFVFTPLSGTGQGRPIDVSPASPDFIALHDVPPLFLRTLLLAEDSAYYGHRGIDLREMPSALVTNWSRGGAARGASTITQQLAKNLFLSRDKQVGRKLQELAITFLLESALGKERILEIYLNIIEWGPDLRGLRPAARHYFDREPGALTPAQMAFLVSIIPGPILYQRSLADGMPGPGLRALVDNLLAKLRSVDAISERDYQQALADPLSLSP